MAFNSEDRFFEPVTALCEAMADDPRLGKNEQMGSLGEKARTEGYLNASERNQIVFAFETLMTRAAKSKG